MLVLSDNIADYFSRRTERLTCNTTDDIAAVLQRELALPVFLPLSFEEFANRTLATILPDSAPLLIPIHMENAGRGIIPELPRTDYNWVFWCINPDVSWARIDRRIDESASPTVCIISMADSIGCLSYSGSSSTSAS